MVWDPTEVYPKVHEEYNAEINNSYAQSQSHEISSTIQEPILALVHDTVTGLPVLDNHDNINNVTNFDTNSTSTDIISSPLTVINISQMDTINEIMSDGIPLRKPRTRQDSSNSIETVSSTSSGEIFNSDYTDTVSSVNSTTYLLKPSYAAFEENAQETLLESYRNETYMSCSSSEMLNEISDEETTEGIGYKMMLNGNIIEPQETDALLHFPADVSDQTASKEEESTGALSESKSKDEDDDPKDKIIDDYIPHSLVPIQENEVIAFNVDEVQPKDYIQITNNVISVDESFLFHSSTSLWDVENGGKRGNRAVTMQNLHEKSSFMDLTDVSKIGKACQRALIYLKDDINFGSLVSINTINAKNIEKDPSQSLSLISGKKNGDVIKSNRHLRNLLALSCCVTLLFIAIGSVRNLQSSINHEGGVGVLSMAFTSVGYLLGSLVSASVVLNFHPRKCIIINLIPNLLYIAANIYPTLWLMSTVSFIQGVSMAILWNAVSTYVIYLSRGKSQKCGESSDQVASRYFGILCLMYQSYLIIGNLIASLILMPGAGDDVHGTEVNLTSLSNATYPDSDLALTLNAMNFMNASQSQQMIGLGEEDVITTKPNSSSGSVKFCGAKFCNHFDMGGSGFVVPDETKYLLFGIYMACIVVALLIAIFLLEPLNPRLFTSSVKPIQKLKTQLSSLAHFLLDVKFILLVPLLMYSVMQFCFITAEFTKAFVTCTMGIHMVGYTMICLGVCGGLSSYLSGLLTKFTGRIPHFILGLIKMPGWCLKLVSPWF